MRFYTNGLNIVEMMRHLIRVMMMEIKKYYSNSYLLKIILAFILCFSNFHVFAQKQNKNEKREKISINSNWKFFKYASLSQADSLIYDVRPEVRDTKDDKPADSKPTEAVDVISNKFTLKAYILPSGNDFLADSGKHYKRPHSNIKSNFPFLQSTFDDSKWEAVQLPHDWGNKRAFLRRLAGRSRWWYGQVTYTGCSLVSPEN